MPSVRPVSGIKQAGRTIRRERLMRIVLRVLPLEPRAQGGISRSGQDSRLGPCCTGATVDGPIRAVVSIEPAADTLGQGPTPDCPPNPNNLEERCAA